MSVYTFLSRGKSRMWHDQVRAGDLVFACLLPLGRGGMRWEEQEWRKAGKTDFGESLDKLRYS